MEGGERGSSAPRKLLKPDDIGMILGHLSVANSAKTLPRIPF